MNYNSERDRLVQLHKAEVELHHATFERKRERLQSSYNVDAAHFNICSPAGIDNWFQYQVASSWIAIDQLEFRSKLFDQYKDALCQVAAQNGFSAPSKQSCADLLSLYVTITPSKRL